MLVRVLSSLSDDQKSWISSTGFDSIISFELNEYPVKLSEYLLSSFEPNPSVLRINEQIFEIGEEDVHEIMGFPRGPADVGFINNVCVKKVGEKFSGRQNNVIKSLLPNFAELLI